MGRSGRLGPRRLGVQQRHRLGHVAAGHQLEGFERFADAVLDRLALRQRRLAQHVAGDLVAMARMADAQPQAPEVAAAQLGLHVLEPVVAGVAATLLELELAGGDLELVVDGEDLLRRDLEEARQRRHRLAGEVHVGHRLQQPDRAGRARRIVHPGDQARVLRVQLRRRLQAARERIDPPEPGVVAGVLVFRAGIAQADKETNHGARLSVPSAKAEGPASGAFFGGRCHPEGGIPDNGRDPRQARVRRGRRITSSSSSCRRRPERQPRR